MGDVLVRGLDDQVIAQMKAKAELRGHSLEQELRDVITAAAPLSGEEKVALARRLRAGFPKLDDFDIHAAIRCGRDDEGLP